MIRIICSRSGLPFEAERKNKKVHPSISHYTSHKDTSIRYPAIAVIERGKAEGWTTIEQFDAEIEKALNPPPPPAVEYDFKGAWVAKIEGYSEKFGYDRSFCKAVETDGRFKKFHFSNEDGFYETCYKSARSNDTRKFYQVENGEAIEIDQDRLNELLGKNPIEAKKTALARLKAACEQIKTGEKRLGGKGEIVKFCDRWIEIVEIEVTVQYEDEDGIVGDRHPDSYVVAELQDYTYWIRPATQEQIAAKQQAIAEREAAVNATDRLEEIFTQACLQPETIAPKGVKVNCRGKALRYDSPYLQIDTEAQLVWSVSYNGRDGDDWSLNNYCGHSIATVQPLTPELQAELETLVAAVANYQEKLKVLEVTFGKSTPKN